MASIDGFDPSDPGSIPGGLLVKAQTKGASDRLAELVYAAAR